ncbi:MAG: hypothetical protein P1U42_12020 [Phycisphaerales bacterium]|nr:hypothetical protein [Phycisphaerales bacterium]
MKTLLYQMIRLYQLRTSVIKLLSECGDIEEVEQAAIVKICIALIAYNNDYETRDTQKPNFIVQ